MPCVAQFDVRSAVEEWMTRRERKPRQVRDVAKFMHQEYVVSFFGTAAKHDNPTLPSVRF